MLDEGDLAGDTQTRRRPSGRRRRSMRRTIVWSVVGLLAALVVGTSLVYTEQSSFCPTCHEMVPYYNAWRTGPHARAAQCVDCHVDSGLLAHLAHKPIALKEVWDHFFRDNRFPNFDVALPNSRCVRCHGRVPDPSGSRFTHARHLDRAQCKDCHARTGHVVSLASLSAEGVLKPDSVQPMPSSGSPSSITGHITVICQRCHDQAKMKCSACHQAPHEPRGECSNCHKPGKTFVYAHTSRTDCASCHKPPANHFGSDCKACHTPTTPFAKTSFTHPATHHDYRSRPCVKCHPNGYTTAVCTCHGGNPPKG